MQGFRQVLKQLHQRFNGRDVALLPSILLLVGSKFDLSPLQLRVHLGLYPEPPPMPALWLLSKIKPALTRSGPSLRPILAEHDSDHDQRTGCDHQRADKR